MPTQIVISLCRTDSNHDFTVPIGAVFHGICHLVQVYSILHYCHIFSPPNEHFWVDDFQFSRRLGQPEIQQGTVCRVFVGRAVTWIDPGPCNTGSSPSIWRVQWLLGWVNCYTLGLVWACCCACTVCHRSWSFYKLKKISNTFQISALQPSALHILHWQI